MSTEVLSITGLRLSRGTRAVLDGVDLEVGAGERVALMGLSGGGKSTVLRAVSALEPFDAGTIVVGGFALVPGPLPRQSRLGLLRRSVGMVFQFHHLFAHLTAVENVSLAQIHAFGLGRAEADARSIRLLDSLGVGARRDARPSELSGGEAQRVAIARALATDPPLLLMDEPTASLDPARRADLAATLAGLTAAGRALLVATHDVPFAHAFATRVAVLAEGRVVEGGRPPGDPGAAHGQRRLSASPSARGTPRS
jgi:ABC-type polar amino acid transport system ATPase subunit